MYCFISGSFRLISLHFLTQLLQKLRNYATTYVLLRSVQPFQTLVYLKKAMKKRTLFCFIAAFIRNLCKTVGKRFVQELVRIICIVAGDINLPYNTQCYTVQLTITCNSTTTHTNALLFLRQIITRKRYNTSLNVHCLS